MSQNAANINPTNAVMKTEREVLLSVLQSARLQIRETVERNQSLLQAIDTALQMAGRADV